MSLLNSFTLFLCSGRIGPDPQFDGDNTAASFPTGQLTSNAWEGWWHDED
ncbi:hypothetical protein [Arthrobacter bambusae]|nr:hypothetical protein [Arthrobacter bambusae]MDQ0028793.1 hypothetical protein [Arthrobacter bambusae]MDQ0096413.1 hypothetical protein [Arthrobacter bambusae]